MKKEGNNEKSGNLAKVLIGLSLIVIAIIVVILVNCKDEFDEPEEVVSTPVVTMVTSGSSVSGTSVTSGTSLENTESDVVTDGAIHTVADLKRQYKFKDNYYETIYNVDKSQGFEIQFKSDVDENAVEVFSDISLTGDSLVDATIEVVDKKKIRIKPKTCSMVSSDEIKENDKAVNYWGNANSYYIVCHYDTESTEKKVLENPLVIPFTVKSDLKSPVISYDVTDGGCLRLSWNNVDGVDGYRVYKLSEDGDKKYPVLQAQLDNKTTSWKDWLVDKNNGIYRSGKNIVMQNAGLSGMYFVTAFKGNMESNFSNKIDISEVERLPMKVSNKTLTSNKVIKGISNLPMRVTVDNIDGTKSKYDIKYKLNKNTKFNDKVYYSYEVKNTKLKGVVKVKIVEGDKVHDEIDNGLSVEMGDEWSSKDITNTLDKKYYGNTDKKDKTKDRTKDAVKSDIDSVKEYRQPQDILSSEESIENSKSEYVNINNHIKACEEKADRDCNNIGLVVDEKDFETIYEKYIYNCIKSRQEQISLRGFYEMTQVSFLEDVMDKVLYQDMLNKYVKSYRYDIDTESVIVEYNEVDEKKLDKLNEKVAQIGEPLKSLSDLDKVERIYNYITGNVEYDKKRKEDSMTAYGALVKNKAVDRGYAEAFKMCCEYAGLDCVIVDGYVYKTKPHVWNMVNIDGEWLSVDCMNNASYTGIQKFVYLTSYDTLNKMNYTIGDKFELKGYTDKYRSKDDNNEYYTIAGRVANSLDEYYKIILNKIKDGEKKIVVRYNGEDNSYSDITAKIATAFKKAKKEKYLTNLQFGMCDGYYVIWYK